MKCPYCHHDDDKVVDSRSSKDGYAIRRRRECLHCQRRYTTFEQLENWGMKVVKKDGIREPFDPGKLRAGISKACWKRPVRDDQIDDLVDDIKSVLYEQYEKEIDSKQLGQQIMQRLRAIDEVAYIRFASVYREFKDVNDFVAEMQPMLDSKPHPSKVVPEVDCERPDDSASAGVP